MKLKVLFRADCNSEIGLGHVIRSLALADMLKERFECTFSIISPPERILNEILAVCNECIKLPEVDNDAFFLSQINNFDIVVLDNYYFDTNFQKTVKAKGVKLVCIDDIHEIHFFADLVINHSSELIKSNYSAEEYTEFCLGFKYSLLRKPFLDIAKKERKITDFKTAFVCLGGSDIDNVSLKFVKALQKLPQIVKINLVLGDVNLHLIEIQNYLSKNQLTNVAFFKNLDAESICNLMEKSEIGFCPASGISLEVCSVGMALFTGYTAANQSNILHSLLNNNLAFNLGDLKMITEDEIIELVSKTIDKKHKMDNMISNQKNIFDGNVAQRIINVLNKIKLKYANEEQ